MTYLLLAIGGALGSLFRYSLGKFMSKNSNTSFPIGTFIINITGAILLGVVTSIHINSNLLLLLGDGFLGAYTTFSTLMYEDLNLFQSKEKLNAYIYILSSLFLGTIGFALGTKIGSV
ncbi:fluoride efflux transporter CrcB [Clostridium sp. Mt-5]|uniref:Fluoride-specific ion channel FluC n=1 Tax=Clostridium moutaii TaxID=3240932 RepID=A0ABV4BRK0_9CLOT